MDLVSQIKPGTKMHMAFAAAVGVEPNFNMVCTFHRPVDETLFLVSVPIVEGGQIIITSATVKKIDFISTKV